MRQISAQQITDTVAKLCIEANCHLSSDIKDRLNGMYEQEAWPQAKEILGRIIENYEKLLQKLRNIDKELNEVRSRFVKEA